MERFKSDQEISEFLLRACHDMRQSTRAVRAHSELLLRDAAKPQDAGAQVSDLEKRLGLIVEGASKIDLLVDGLARYSIALQTASSPFQSIRLGVLLRSVLARLDREIKAANADVTYGELPQISGNPDRLMELLENLLRNAIVHRGEDAPRIHIQAIRQSDEWVFTVQDNGPGVEADYPEQIFKPFARLHGKPRHGVGLGLAICREIVERHGGRIWVAPQGKGGAAFSFTLPAMP